MSRYVHGVEVEDEAYYAYRDRQDSQKERGPTNQEYADSILGKMWNPKLLRWEKCTMCKRDYGQCDYCDMFGRRKP